jgi:toxin ParE1/3/4
VDVVVSPAARDDIRSAYAFYAERRPAAARRVVQAILDAIGNLTEYPLIGRVGLVPGTRERLLVRYPYKIVYEIQGSIIEVDRVRHTAQRWP